VAKESALSKAIDPQFTGDSPAAELPQPRAVTDQGALEEAKLIRRMQMMMNMVMNVIAQDATLTIDDASQMIADARTAALAMFPGKELAYDLIWRPRFQRLMRERFRLM
jgi:hypothetical protein